MSDSPAQAHHAPVRRLAAWLNALVRVGYLSKGIVYFAIGAISLRTAFGVGRETADQSRVFTTILDQPFGEIMLAVLALGLVGYAVWRFAQAFLDLELDGRAFRGLVRRVAYGVSALVYLGFAYTAVRLIFDARRVDTMSARGWTEWLLEQPFGAPLVAAVGVIMLGVAIFQLRHGITADFCDGLAMERMSKAGRRLCLGLGRLGHIARSVVFAIIGLFLLVAAIRTDASEARGISEALSILLKQPFGPWLLGVVAAGFVVYGLYAALEAVYHRVEARRAFS